jgi:membrane protease YdiL (CAAX protease family)
MAGAVVAAPLVEELILRGLLLPALTRSRLRFTGAAIVTTVLFVIMHPGGLAKLDSVWALLDWHLIMSLGLCATWWVTRSVWPCRGARRKQSGADRDGVVAIIRGWSGHDKRT